MNQTNYPWIHHYKLGYTSQTENSNDYASCKVDNGLWGGLLPSLYDRVARWLIRVSHWRPYIDNAVLGWVLAG